jgi:D-alanyl-D-alanine carboxypeptidase
MAGLIEDQIENGATVRTASAIQDNASPDLPPRPRAEARQAAPDLPLRAQAQPETQDSPRPTPPAALAYAEPQTAAAVIPGQKITLRALAPAALPAADLVREASIAPDAPSAKTRPAYISGAAQPQPAAAAAGKKAPANAALARTASLDGSTAQSGDATASIVTPSTMRWVAGPAPAKDRKTTADRPVEKAAPQKAATEPADSAASETTRRPAAAHTGWMIQIGATDDVAKANALLAKAKADGRNTLGRAQPFTEKVQKGASTLYRARFAGLEADSAELACKTLKRTGFSCFATKN